MAEEASSLSRISPYYSFQNQRFLSDFDHARQFWCATDFGILSTYFSTSFSLNHIRKGSFKFLKIGLSIYISFNISRAIIIKLIFLMFFWILCLT
jgi:hypothetical protein